MLWCAVPGIRGYEAHLALKVVVPFFKGFQKLVRTFSIWGRHFLSVCRKSLVEGRKPKKYQGF